jgi:hypothetical protein
VGCLNDHHQHRLAQAVVTSLAEYFDRHESEIICTVHNIALSVFYYKEYSPGSLGLEVMWRTENGSSFKA